MKISVWNIGLAVLSLVGAGLFGYSLVQQTALQGQMNDTMSLINHSIVSTGQAVSKTSDALAPLTETTAALAAIETSEEHVVADLHGMNTHLAVIGDHEHNLLSGLDQLNATTTGVGSHITEMRKVNNSLMQSGTTSVSQANQEAGDVETLSQMTQDTISQLRQLNEKLAPLRVLP